MENTSLLALFVVFSLALLPVASAQNMVTGEVTRTFDQIKASVPKTITETVLSPAGTPIFEIRLDVNSLITQGRVSLESTTPEKAKLQATPGGVVYAYMNVSSKNIPDSKIDSLRTKFRVGKEWMEGNGIEKDGVKMLLLTPERWAELETTLLSEDSENVVYQSESKAFGIMAISGAGTEPQAQPEADAGSESEAAAVESEGSDSGAAVSDIVPTQEVVEKKTQDELFWAAVGIVVVIAAVVLIFVPGKIFRGKYHYHHKA